MAVELFADGAAEVSVRDDGPGVPADERGRPVARFNCGNSGSDGDGCGPGLSIVTRIVERAGALLSFGDGLARPGGVGLEVRVRFPAPAAHGD